MANTASLKPVPAFAGVKLRSFINSSAKALRALSRTKLGSATRYAAALCAGAALIVPTISQATVIPTGTPAGTVESWGLFVSSGQTNVPAGLSNVVAVAGGRYHSLALKFDGTVVGWGGESPEFMPPDAFNYGQITPPVDLTNVVAVAAGDFYSLALKSDGTVASWGPNWGEAPPPSATNVIKIAAGSYHSLALKNDGTIVAWGDNSFGETDVAADLTNVVDIAAGQGVSLALKSDGTVVAWGLNDQHQLDIPADLTNVVKIFSGDYHCLALKVDGSVVAWGDTSGNQTYVPLGMVISLAGNNYSSVALKMDGTLEGWGAHSTPSGLTNVVALAAGDQHYLIVVATNYSPTAVQLSNNAIADGQVGGTQVGILSAVDSDLGDTHTFSLVTGAGSDDNDFFIVSGNALNTAATLNYSYKPSYSIRVRATDGSGLYFEQQLTVIVGAAVITQQPEDASTLENGSASLTVGATGGALAYQWYKGGVAVAGATSSSLTFGSAAIADSGIYTVVVSNVLGAVTSTNATLCVTVTNALPKIYGTYYGIFYSQNGASQTSSGFVQMAMKKSGRFTAKVRVDGGTFTLTGTFSSNGVVTTNISRAAVGKADLAISWSADTCTWSDQITGTISSAGWTAQFISDRVNSTNNATLIGKKYTIALPGLSNAATGPTGYGYAVLGVGVKNKGVLSGRLGDGTPFMQKVPLSRTGQFPLFAAPYASTGVVIGWLNVTPATVAADVYYSKPAGVGGFYPNGFTNQCTILASPFDGTAKPVIGSTGGTYTLSAGNLPLTLNGTFTLSPLNSFVFTPLPTVVGLKAQASKAGAVGTVVGTVKTAGVLRTIRGIILQDQKLVLGHFVGTTQTGKVLLQGN